MTLHIRDTDPNFEVETTKGPVRFHDWIDYRGLTPDQRQRMQHVAGAAETARAQALQWRRRPARFAGRRRRRSGHHPRTGQGGHRRDRQMVARLHHPTRTHRGGTRASYAR